MHKSKIQDVNSKNERLLEISLFFILIFQTLRSNLLANNLALVLIALLFLCFISFTLSMNNPQNLKSLKVFFRSKKILKQGKNLSDFKNLILISLAISVFVPMLVKAINERKDSLGKVNINESMIMVEHATKILFAGINPYSISYVDAVRHEKNQSGQKEYEIEDLNHFQYSPLVFWLTVPSYIFFQNLFNFYDLRIILFLLFFVSAFAGFLLVNKNTLFLIIYLFNPVFLSSLMLGSNDVLPLTFLFLSLIFMRDSKITYSTIALALASGSKLIAIPFIPIYFGYLLKSRMGKGIVFKQLAVFIIVSLFIYLPFAIWNFRDFMSDLVIYQIGGGSTGKPIVGFLGLPQILHNLGLIAQNSRLPFFIVFLPAYVIFLYFYLMKIKKNDEWSFLLVGYIFSFFLFLIFSRMIQSDYIAYISQFLVLAAFLADDGKLRRR